MVSIARLRLAQYTHTDPVDSGQLVAWILARACTISDQLPTFQRRVDSRRTPLSHRGADSILGDPPSPQVRHPRGRSPYNAVLVRWIRCAGRVLERSRVLWACVLSGEGGGGVWCICLVGYSEICSFYSKADHRQALLCWDHRNGADACSANTNPERPTGKGRSELEYPGGCVGRDMIAAGGVS